MQTIIEEEIKKNHNQADVFISLFFAGLDAVCYIIILTLFGCDFGIYNSPKEKLSILIVIDAVLRIINMYTDEYSKYFKKEFFFTSISTIQFYIIISCLNQILEKSNEANLDTDLQIRNKTPMIIIFFSLVFSFKGILSSYKLISVLQYICIIIGIYILLKYIGSKIEAYLAIIVKKDPSFGGENFVNNIPFFISLYFMINYLIEIINLFVEHKLYESYIIMICKIFKEVGKYLVFLLLMTCYHTFSKYISEEVLGFNSDEVKVSSSDKNNANIYKDEDYYDDD